MLKDQTWADFLDVQPIPIESSLKENLPNELILHLGDAREHHWQLYFNGETSSQRGNDPQIIIIFFYNNMA